MSSYIPAKLRELVAKRANCCCEYCLIPERFSFFKFHLDHIIGLKHGGETTAENLANSCSVYNENKGSDIATFVVSPEQIVRFFNPRIDDWSVHFKLETTGEITPLTDVGRATLKIFRFNHPDSIVERRRLIEKNWKFLK